MALAGRARRRRYREALADCVEETDRVLVMLNTLMDISEAESGAMPLHREPVPPAPSRRARGRAVRDVADAKGRHARRPATTRRRRRRSADRVRLEQVAANLIDNAMKYTPPGGQRRSSTSARDDGRALLRVRDTGAGIPADELPRIWDRLFRGDTSRTERGLGLGLSLVKAIVEAHGGTVEVASEPGRGSTFTVACLSRLTRSRSQRSRPSTFHPCNVPVTSATRADPV